MRDLSVVIDNMLAVIPEEEVELRQSLLDCKSSYIYGSPETVGLRWQITMEVLVKELGETPDLSKDWVRSLLDVWTDKI